MKECALALPEESKANLVDRSRTECPRVADVQLLNSLIRQITEARHISPTRLKPRKRLCKIVLSEIVVSRQMLLGGQLVIDLHRELIAALMAQRDTLKETVTNIRVRHKFLKQGQRCLVHARLGDHVIGENGGVSRAVLNRRVQPERS